MNLANRRRGGLTEGIEKTKLVGLPWRRLRDRSWARSILENSTACHIVDAKNPASSARPRSGTATTDYFGKETNVSDILFIC